MTPGARVAAAIEVLDIILGGASAEQTLTRWGRQNRYAGSKDRAAVRDHVFDVIRRKRSVAALGGSEDGRAMMIGLLRQTGIAPETLFTGIGHAPTTLSKAEQAVPEVTDPFVLWNMPDWLIPEIQRSLGAGAEEYALLSQQRAPVCLRVNTARTDRDRAQAKLLEEGVATRVTPLCDTALIVTEGARRVRNSDSFTSGLVELQDAASQAVVADLPKGPRVLDYCAGGGGKALAVAMQADRTVLAHDIDPGRMRDLPLRAERAGVEIETVETQALADLDPFDVVLCDAPCSGSGAWRRAPDGKWSLTQERLAALNAIQDDVLASAAKRVAADGVLVYATCSVLTCENEDRIAAFVASHPEWSVDQQKRFPVSTDGDGFFAAHLTRVSS